MNLGASHVALAVKTTYQCWRCKRHRFDPSTGKSPRGVEWQTTPVCLTGEFPGAEEPGGYSPCGCK